MRRGDGAACLLGQCLLSVAEVGTHIRAGVCRHVDGVNYANVVLKSVEVWCLGGLGVPKEVFSLRY